MPCWYYEKKDLKTTPSIRDGLDFETERRYRREGARFIMQCGTEMSLGHNTIATGAVYFHRFYMSHSFKTFPRYVTACCCLFLAGKVEETPKKCRDIINSARTMVPDPKFQAFSEDIKKAKEEVMTLESILLQTIKFDLQVEHPYSFLVKYAKCLKGDQLKLQKIVQMAWNFVNDSLSTTVCLQWEPEIIAVALIYLACKLSKFKVTNWIGRQPIHLQWWDMFIADGTLEILESVCHQVLDLYAQSNSQSGAASPPTNPANKTSPAEQPKRNNISPQYKTASPTAATTPSVPSPQMAIPPKQASTNNKLDNHPIPKLITGQETTMHYAYPPVYGAWPPHQPHPTHPMSAHPAHLMPGYAPGPPTQPPPMVYPYPQPPIIPHYQQCNQPPNYYNQPPPRATGYYPGPS